MRKFTRFLAVASMAALVSASAYASGFAIQEQSVSGLGNAFAGAAATASDASTIFFNPAGLAKLEGQNVSIGLHTIIPSVKFTDNGSLNQSGLVSPGGNDGGNGGNVALVPSAYYSYTMGKLAFGLGIYAPFGLKTEYNKGWVGRYYAIESDMKTININPVVAYKVNDMVSLGLGLSAQHVEATLTKALDVGLFAGVNPPNSVPSYDVISSLEADGWAYGFTLGAIFDFSDAVTVGVNYRSRYKYDLDGDASFTAADPSNLAMPTVMTAVGIPAATAATTELTLPDVLSLSAVYRLNSQWELLGDISWTHWATFDELRVEFTTPVAGSSTSTEEYQWENTWKVALGANFMPNEKMIFRCGLAYDESPVPSAELRTPRVPDEDRTWVSLGGGYAFNDMMNLDVAYTHIFVKEAEINNSSAGLLKGDFDYSIDIISAQLNMAF